MVKLDIGGGKNKRDEDFIGVDICGSPDVKAKMWALPFKDASVDFIWSGHTLEHAPFAKVIETLAEWYRVLKPGGRLILQVPNMDYVAKYWLTGKDRAWAEAMIFGAQSDEGDFHKSAFTSDTLRGDLKGTGFEVVRVELKNSYSQESLQAVALKPKA